MSERTLPAVLLVVALISCGPAQSDELDQRSGAEFSVSSDQAEAVVRVSIRNRSPLGMPTNTYTLYGDGRLEAAEVFESAAAAKAARAPVITRLDAPRLRSIVQLVAVPSLVEVDEKKIAEQLQAATQGFPDGSLVAVDLRLSAYTRGGVTLRPVARRFVLVEPLAAAKRAPDVEPLQALASLVREMTALAAPVASPTFVASTDHDEAVLKVTVPLGMTRQIESWTLFGDGRLEYATAQRGGGVPTAVVATREVHLTPLESDALLALVAVPALIEADETALADRLAVSPGPDVGMTTIDFRFLSYSRGKVSLAPVERTLRTYAPALQAQRHPAAEDFTALAALIRALVAHTKPAEVGNR